MTNALPFDAHESDGARATVRRGERRAVEFLAFSLSVDLRRLAIGLQEASAEVSRVSYSHNVGRSGILVLVIVGLAAATAAASRWTPWSPLGTCLFCGSAPREVASVLPQAPLAHDGSSGASHDSAHRVPNASSHLDSGPLPSFDAHRAAEYHESGSHGDDSRHDWQPWGFDSSHRVNNDSTTVLGGLSRLTGGYIAGGASTVRPNSPAAPIISSHPEQNDPPSPTTPSGPAPVGGPTPTPPPPSTGTPTPPMPPTVALGPTPPAGGGFTPNVPVPAPAPTDPFRSQNTPAPTPFAPPAPTGPLGGTDPAGVLVTNSGTPAPNPEPASLMLLATGVAAVFGELRRRRMI